MIVTCTCISPVVLDQFTLDLHGVDAYYFNVNEECLPVCNVNLGTIYAYLPKTPIHPKITLVDYFIIFFLLG